MTQATQGDHVKVHYTGTLRDGAQFDSSRDRQPLELEIGKGQVIPGFEAAIVGMASGDQKTVTIPFADAYGPRQDALIRDFPRREIPDHIELEKGLVLTAQGPDGRTVRFTVRDFDDTSVTLDGNHPLAGEDLTFEIEVVDIRRSA